MQTYRPDIDGLRAIAVSAVVLFHAGVPVFSGGFVGVDVFFVISGYLITSIILDDLNKERFSVARFYVRRVRRIVPALTAVILVTGIVACTFYLPPYLERFGLETAAAATFLSNVFYWRTSGYFSPQADELTLLHFWSLAVEEQFYLFFPPFMWVIYRLTGNRGLTIAFAAIALISLMIATWAVTAKPVAAFYLFPTRAWELLIGGFLALGILPSLTRQSASLVSFVGIAAMFSAIGLYSVQTPFPGLTALLPCLGTAAVIYAGRSSTDTTVARGLSTRPMVQLGLVSYSLYLWHWPLLVMPNIILGRHLTAVETALAVTAALLLAILCWRFVEQPFRTPRRNDGSFTLPLATGGTVLAVMAVAGVMLFKADGIPARVSSDVAAALQAEQDRTHLENCIVATGSNKFEDRCDAPSRIFLWGDSHASHLTAGFQELYGVDAIAYVGTGGCPPVTGVLPVKLPPIHAATMAFNNNRESEYCRDLNRAILESLTKREGVDLVVLSAAWAFFTEGTELATREGRFLVENFDEEPSVLHSRSLLADRLQKVLATLEEHDIPVLLVGDVPQSAQPPSICLARAGMTPGASRSCALPAQLALERLERSNTLLKNFSTTGRASVFLPSNVLCNAESCEVLIGNTFIYADADHLTSTASRVLAAEMRQVIGP